MANTHGQISRIGIILQTNAEMPGFPGWCRDYLQKRTGVRSGQMGPVMAGGGSPPPVFLRNVKAGKNVKSRELIHTLGTYPNRASTRWRYQVDMEVNGESNVVFWKTITSPLNRASHRGPDQGAESAVVRIIGIRVVGVDGHWMDFEVNKLLDDYINGWKQYDRVHSGFVNWNAPIQSVRFQLSVSMGHEEYHDSGDGYTPPADYSASTPCAIGYDSAVPAGNVNVKHDVIREYRPTSEVFKQWPVVSSAAGNAIIEQYVDPVTMVVVDSKHTHTKGGGGDHNDYSYSHTTPVGSSGNWRQSCTSSWGGSVYSGGPLLYYSASDAGTVATATNAVTGQVINLTYNSNGSMVGKYVKFKDILPPGTWHMRMGG